MPAVDEDVGQIRRPRTTTSLLAVDDNEHASSGWNGGQIQRLGTTTASWQWMKTVARSGDRGRRRQAGSGSDGATPPRPLCRRRWRRRKREGRRSVWGRWGGRWCRWPSPRCLPTHPCLGLAPSSNWFLKREGPTPSPHSAITSCRVVFACFQCCSHLPRPRKRRPRPPCPKKTPAGGDSWRTPRPEQVRQPAGGIYWNWASFVELGFIYGIFFKKQTLVPNLRVYVVETQNGFRELLWTMLRWILEQF